PAGLPASHSGSNPELRKGFVLPEDSGPISKYKTLLEMEAFPSRVWPGAFASVAFASAINASTADSSSSGALDLTAAAERAGRIEALVRQRRKAANTRTPTIPTKSVMRPTAVHRSPNSTKSPGWRYAAQTHTRHT